MGKILIGKGKKTEYDSVGFMGVSPTAPVKTSKENTVRYTEVEKMKIYSTVLANTSRDQHVSTLRGYGFNDLADSLERTYAEEDAKALQEKMRKERLEEIHALPEEEQLPVLLEEGYYDEAEELSERLAKKKAEEEAIKAAAEAAEAEKGMEKENDPEPTTEPPVDGTDTATGDAAENDGKVNTANDNGGAPAKKVGRPKKTEA